jgi:hypothetical protein
MPEGMVVLQIKKKRGIKRKIFDTEGWVYTGV